jgi:Heterokaryon incompatibility protein (HET)
MAEAEDLNPSSASDIDSGPTINDILKLPKFKYNEFPTPTCIRLLEILPSRPGVIRCNMFGLDLGEELSEYDQLPYIALSYTWGNPITVYEEPAPKTEGYKMPDDYVKLPYVFTSHGPKGSTLHNIDFAKKYYIETYPWIPHERVNWQNGTLKPIEINGCLIHIQENLHHFLNELQHMKHVSNLGTASEKEDTYGYLNWAINKPIWIDALCINQNDLTERASQVQLIGRIFSCADSVFAWLGPKDGFTFDALLGLSSLSDHKSDLKDSGTSSLSSITDMDLVSWFSLLALFQRLWFRRAWVAQEAIFGRRVIVLYEAGITSWEVVASAVATLERTGLDLEMIRLGRSLLTSQPLSGNTRQLRRLAFCLDDDDKPSPDDPVPRLDVEPKDALAFICAVQFHRVRLERSRSKDDDEQGPPARPPSLLSVLSMFRNTMATDPRDKVFAFLNLASDTLGLVPDYRASVESVFRSTAEAILRRTKSLSILSQVQGPCDTQIENLPGWVPDFSCRLHSTPLDTGGDDVSFCASGIGTEAYFDINDDGTLEVDGIQVTFVIESPNFENDNQDIVDLVLKTALRTPPQYPISNEVVVTMGFPKGTLRSSDIDSVIMESDEDSPIDEMPDVEDFDQSIPGEWSDDKNLEARIADETCSNGDERIRLLLQESDIDSLEVPSPDEIPINEDGDVNVPCEDSNDKDKVYTSEVRITRIEALWRTLVCDTFQDSTGVTHPAPYSIGHGFSDWILVHLLEALYLCNDLHGSDDGIDDIARLTNRNFLSTFVVWGALYQHKHIPLTKDTIDFSLEVPDLAGLARDEQMQEDVIGFIDSGDSFLTGALRLQTYLKKKLPSRDVLTREGDPQAAVHGQWREAALLQFTDVERVNIHTFEKMMRTMTEGRRLFCTNDGLLGLGPRSIGEEDRQIYEVWILKGAKVPYILSKLEGGRYRLIGEAYVHGIMHGEIVRRFAHLDWCQYQKIKLA